MAGIPATLNGSSKTDTALPCRVVLHDVTSSAEDTAITATANCRGIDAAFRGSAGGPGGPHGELADTIVKGISPRVGVRVPRGP
ncbi:hypothetical protein MGAD_55670 [Mycolicibacterium gadium]|uniref:Uncharacterized protein n=1 Tax=Mycolicibacterium gadium TaxID=1794 RepID=A0A7I7WVY3_MYCGU|nr:hypothetical protein MGAD_55670 [Mycolicibacterium gadium]